MSDEAIVRQLVDRAMVGAEQLSLTGAADLHHAASIILGKWPGLSFAAEHAAHTARLYREADSHQLKFRELLKEGRK